MPSRGGNAPSAMVLNKPMISYENYDPLCSQNLDIDDASASLSSLASSASPSYLTITNNQNNAKHVI